MYISTYVIIYIYIYPASMIQLQKNIHRGVGPDGFLGKLLPFGQPPGRGRRAREPSTARTPSTSTRLAPFKHLADEDSLTRLLSAPLLKVTNF